MPATEMATDTGRKSAPPSGSARKPQEHSHKPLLVSRRQAEQIIGCKTTKFWKLVKEGRIQMADMEGHRLVVYASLEALANPKTA